MQALAAASNVPVPEQRNFLVGSAGKHHPTSKQNPKFRIRRILIASGVTLGVAASATWAFAATAGSAPEQMNAHLAQNQPPTPAASHRPLADPAATKESAIKRSATKTGTHKSKPKAKAKKAKRAAADRVVGTGSCKASYYGEGQMTASGEAFDPSELTAAHRTLSFGTKIRVINANSGRSAVIRINDRGPFVSGRCLDLSTASMRAVGGMGSGVIPVKFQVLA
jgi:rare lipoprotein A